jgi:hypothetical protein
LEMAITTLGQSTQEINYGQNIYRSYTDRESEYGHTWLQGNRSDVVVGNFSIVICN